MITLSVWLLISTSMGGEVTVLGQAGTEQKCNAAKIALIAKRNQRSNNYSDLSCSPMEIIVPSR